jgi:hypothetical protein
MNLLTQEQSLIETIRRAASSQNAWSVIGVICGPALEGTYPHGLIVFDRGPAYRHSFGTAEYIIVDGERVVFEHGHYDLPLHSAYVDLSDRILSL